MNGFEKNVLLNAREILLKKDIDASGQNSVIELVAHVFGVSYVDVIDLIHGVDCESVDSAPTQFRLYIDGDGSRKYQFAKEAIADLDRIARASDFGSATLIYIGDE